MGHQKIQKHDLTFSPPRGSPSLTKLEHSSTETVKEGRDYNSGCNQTLETSCYPLLLLVCSTERGKEASVLYQLSISTLLGQWSKAINIYCFVNFVHRYVLLHPSTQKTVWREQAFNVYLLSARMSAEQNGSQQGSYFF